MTHPIIRLASAGMFVGILATRLSAGVPLWLPLNPPPKNVKVTVHVVYYNPKTDKKSSVNKAMVEVTLNGKKEKGTTGKDGKCTVTFKGLVAPYSGHADAEKVVHWLGYGGTYNYTSYTGYKDIPSTDKTDIEVEVVITLGQCNKKPVEKPKTNTKSLPGGNGDVGCSDVDLEGMMDDPNPGEPGGELNKEVPLPE